MERSPARPRAPASSSTETVEVAGLDTMNFHMAFGNISYDNVCRTAELFAAEVMPAFAEAGARPRKSASASPSGGSRRRAVQVLAGDRAPVGAGAELPQDDRDDPVHPADQDGLGRQRELVHLLAGVRGALLVGPGARGAAAPLASSDPEPA